MSDVSITMGVDNRQAITALRQIEAQTDKISDAFNGLKSAIAGLALGGVIQQIATYATTVTNSSRATDIAMSSVKAYADAVKSSGGEVQGAVEDLIEFTKQIHEARNGSDETAKMFAMVGISLSDLRKMSNQDILEATLNGLSKMEDSSRRNKIALDLLGGEMKKVSVIDVAKGFQGNMGTNQNAQAAAAVESIAKAQRNLGGIFRDVGNQILDALKPIAEFAADLKVSHEAIKKTIDFMKELLYWGGQIALFFAGGWIANTFLRLGAVAVRSAAAIGDFFIGLSHGMKILKPLEGAFAKVTGYLDDFLIKLGGKSAEKTKDSTLTTLKEMADDAAESVESLTQRMISLGTTKSGNLSKVNAKKNADEIKRLNGKLQEAKGELESFNSQIMKVETQFGKLGAKITMFGGIVASTAYNMKDFFVAIWTGVAPLNSVEAAIHSVIKPIKDLAVGFIDGYNAVNDFVKSIPYVGEILSVIIAPVHALIWAFKDLFSDAEGGGQIMNALGASLEFVARGVGELLNLPTNIIGKLLGYDWNEAMGLGDGFLKIAKAAEQARKGLKPATVDPSENNAEMAKLMRQQAAAQKASKAAVVAAKQESEERKRLRVEIDAIGKSFAANNALKQQDLVFQTGLIGKTDEQKESMTAINELTKSYDSIMLGLLQKHKEWSVGTEEQKLSVGLIKQEMEKVALEYQRQVSLTSENVSMLQAARIIDADRLRVFENITKQMERQATLGGIIQSANDRKVGVEFESSLMKMSPFEQQKAKILEDARIAALEAGRTFASSFEESGDGLSAERATELANGLSQIAEKYKGIADIQIQSLNGSRTWASGWSAAFKEYADSATNAAQMARDSFSAVTSGMDRMIDNFVETGKFSMKDFARSVIADLVKIQLKAQMVQAMKMFGGSSIGTAIGSFFGGFFADGGQPPMNKASIVGERGPELFVPRAAGTVIPNHKMGSSAPITNNHNTYITNSVSAVDAKSVAQLFQENRKQLFGVVEQAKKEMPGRSR